MMASMTPDDSRRAERYAAQLANAYMASGAGRASPFTSNSSNEGISCFDPSAWVGLGLVSSRGS